MRHFSNGGVLVFWWRDSKLKSSDLRKVLSKIEKLSELICCLCFRQCSRISDWTGVDKGAPVRKRTPRCWDIQHLRSFIYVVPLHGELPRADDILKYSTKCGQKIKILFSKKDSICYYRFSVKFSEKSLRPILQK